MSHPVPRPWMWMLRACTGSALNTSRHVIGYPEAVCSILVHLNRVPGMNGFIYDAVVSGALTTIPKE